LSWLTNILNSADVDLFAQDLLPRILSSFAELGMLAIDDRVEIINAIRAELHKYSPFAAEPVDCVQWVAADTVTANDYNPNSVAPPEMRLLERSILADGYTQPIVAWRNGTRFEVVDGFHRNRVGKECASVRERVHGYLPLSVVNSDRLDRGDRIAATIRHNRARGKHKVEAMSDIVIELKRRNWSDEKIGNELGMDPDEVLRLTQITGLAEMFADQEFSASWDLTDPPAEEQIVLLEEEV
jgi:ParB-like chromosome segregation protein Spo0J